MARPCKSVNVMSKNLTNEEKERRLETEKKLSNHLLAIGVIYIYFFFR